MLKKSLIVLALAAAAVAPAQAQSKKELVARILKAQQQGIEALAQQLAEEPAEELLARASAALPQRVAADKQEQVGKEIQADINKYLDEAVPLVKASAIKLAPASAGAVLEQKLSVEELKQVVQIVESPAYVKFQALAPELQKALADKLVAETKDQISPKVRNLETTIGKRLGVAPNGK